jgi:pimeloyl-ACP methyl ester carboxylesterase
VGVESCVHAAGASIRCLSMGEGRPLILCHGFLSSGEEFEGRFRALARDRRLIIPDLPGNGKFPPLPRRHTVERIAAALEDMLDDEQLVELTHFVALENMRGRFNRALGVGSAGFSDGMVCAVAATVEPGE